MGSKPVESIQNHRTEHELTSADGALTYVTMRPSLLNLVEKARDRGA